MAFLLPGHKRNARGAATSPSSAVESGKRAAKILREKNVQGIKKLGAECGSPTFCLAVGRCWFCFSLCSPGAAPLGVGLRLGRARSCAERAQPASPSGAIVSRLCTQPFFQLQQVPSLTPG